MTEQPDHDPATGGSDGAQDAEFGAEASRDQDLVDDLERQGVTADELPDDPARHPRAAGKAAVDKRGSTERSHPEPA